MMHCCIKLPLGLRRPVAQWVEWASHVLLSKVKKDPGLAAAQSVGIWLCTPGGSPDQIPIQTRKGV